VARSLLVGYSYWLDRYNRDAFNWMLVLGGLLEANQMDEVSLVLKD